MITKNRVAEMLEAAFNFPEDINIIRRQYGRGILMLMTSACYTTYLSYSGGTGDPEPDTETKPLPQNCNPENSPDDPPEEEETPPEKPAAKPEWFNYVV